MRANRAVLLAALVGVAAVTLRAAEPPGQPEAVTVYDAKADHPWNRLHRALFVRTTRDGKEVGRDALDPLLWPQTNHLLRGPSHKEALGRLDDLLEPGVIDAVGDPLKRAVLQRDLWAVLEWAAAPHASRYPPQDFPAEAHPAARKALQAPLAKAIRKLALSPRAVAELPDNYAAAVRSKAFPARFDPEHPDRPFLPHDLFDPDGPWVCLGGARDGPPLALAHTQFFAGRSVFLVFLRLPDGRRATLDYLDKLDKVKSPWVTREGKRSDGTPVELVELRPDLPQFPVGTQVALVRQMALVTDEGKLEASPVTESVQLRVYRRIPPGTNLDHKRALESQAFFEFELRRADLFAGNAGGLRPVPPDEPAYLTLQFLTGYDDPFEKPPDKDRSHLMPARDTCAACHTGAGIHSVNSYTRGFSERPERRPQLTLRSTRSADEQQKALDWKRRHETWKLFQALAER